ncbi:MAG: hypothetical protein ACRD29_05240 [Acidimicrobiales bacterium]
MSEPMGTPEAMAPGEATATGESTASGERRDAHPLVRAAWQSGLLGLIIGFIPFVGDLMADRRTGGALVAGLAAGLAWSLAICVSLAVGVRRAAKLSLLGLVIAPVAALLGEAMHEVVEEALLRDEAVRIPAVALAVVRGLEYGTFGLLLRRVRRRPARTWASIGGLVGAVAGAVVLVLWEIAGSLSAGELAAQGVNELVFPAGCALVLKDVYSPRAGAPS